LIPAKFVLDKYRRWIRAVREQSWENYGGSPVKMKNGVQLLLNPNCAYSGVLFARRVSAVAELHFARNIINPGDIAIDVGANIGYTTAALSKFVGPYGKVLAFEPSPTTFSFLTRNLQLNKCQNVTAYQVALAEKDNVGLLYESEHTSGDNRMYMPNSDPRDRLVQRQAIEVEQKTLSTYLTEIDVARLSFLKIDAQGYECRILQGAAELLHESPMPAILVEFTPRFLTEIDSTPEKLWDLAQQLDMGMALLKGAPRPGPRITLQPLDHSDLRRLTHQLQRYGGPAGFEMLVLSRTPFNI